MTLIETILEDAKKELGVFNSNFADLLTQNGSVEMTAEEQRKLGDEICQCGENLVNRLLKKIIPSLQTIREKTVEEAIEQIKDYIGGSDPSCHAAEYYEGTSDILNLLQSLKSPSPKP